MQTRGNPFTLLSCDNLQSNGDTSRKALLAFAGLRSDSLQNWIAANVTFPNSMVDRITPRTTDEDRAAILRDYSIDDLCPVVTEPFRQWVLEDNFAAGRPALEKADVQFSSEVDLYEKTKMRLLNGGHICIAYCSALLGLRFVSNALADPLLHQLLTSFLAEVRVTLHDLPGISLDDYTASVLHRFSNVTIRDQIPRICSDGTAKMSKYIVPALTDLLAAGAPSQLPQLVIATWLFYLKGHAEDGTPITISDPLVDALSPFVASGGTDASLALSVRRVFGDLSVRHPQFAMNVQHYLNQLQAFGVRATIADALAKF
jgi:mannitol 2-dehydrogenase